MHKPTSIRAYPNRTLLPGITFLLPVVAYIIFALQRIGTPQLLEWMEGGSLQMMHRVLSGEPLYGAPSIEFVPYTYTPLYFYISALVSGVVGTDLLSLRLVSFTASLASYVILFLIIRRETGGSFGGMAAVGLFAGSYAVNGNWFDIARIDSLCIALLLAGAWLGLGERRPRNLILGGILVALSFFTKQVTLVVLGPLILAVLMRQGKAGLYFAFTGLLVIVIGSLVLDTIYEGWFLFYVLESPRRRWQSNLSGIHLARAALLEFVPIFIISVAVCAPLLGRLLRRPTLAGTSFLMVIGGLFLAAAWGRVESINFLNSSIPAHLGMALLFGLAVGTYTRDSSDYKTPIALTGAFVAQIAIFSVMIGPLIPTKREILNYSNYSSLISSLPKPVYLPDQGYVRFLGPTNSFAHSIGIMDLMMGGSSSDAMDFRREMEGALTAKKFGAIVCETSLFQGWFQEALERNYELVPTSNHEGTWTPVLGFTFTPLIFRPRGGKE